MNGMTVETTVHFGRGMRSERKLREGNEKPAPTGRIPRVAKLLALAIRFEQLVQDGIVTDYAELARLGDVTRARMSQIMNLLNLAPDIQEAILFLPRVERGKDSVTERDTRRIGAMADWRRQREEWRQLLTEPV